MAVQDNEKLALKYFDNAYSLHLAGKLADAIDAYKVSIAYHPTAKAYTFLGWAYSLQGRFDEAIHCCHIAIDLDPELGNPYNDIGSYYISLGKYEEAVPWLEKALDALNYEPRHYPYYNLGLVYEKTGDWLTAMNYYSDALEINPEYEEAKSAFIRITTLLN